MTPPSVNPKASSSQSVLNENLIPMVSRASNSIGLMLQPTAAPAANDPILNSVTFTLPGFYIQQPAGATEYVEFDSGFDHGRS
jgi:hypothetical protein